MIKRIYKDFIIAFLNSRGEIPFTFLKERLKEETLLNPHSKAISIYFLFSVINMDSANRILSLENFNSSLWRVTVMIREFKRDDINKVADIWLDTNIKAHNFIPAEYWKSNFRSVKEALLLAEVYVYEYDTEIQGFIGLNDEYVEGIFVSGEMQSQGIGKILLNYAKDKRNKLHLNVYQKNARAISFYKREGFEIQHSGLDEATGEKDYVMTWQHK